MEVYQRPDNLLLGDALMVGKQTGLDHKISSEAGVHYQATRKQVFRDVLKCDGSDADIRPARPCGQPAFYLENRVLVFSSARRITRARS
jgi:hypothetical protein